MENRNNKLLPKRLLAILLVITTIISMVPSVFAEEAQPSAKSNSWQIVDEGGETEYDEVHLHKTVEPTETENEFTVRIAVDANCLQIVTSEEITKMLEIDGTNNLYVAGTANGFPTPYSGQEHNGNGSLASGVKGSEK